MKVNEKDDIPYIMEKNVWNHQPGYVSASLITGYLIYVRL